MVSLYIMDSLEELLNRGIQGKQCYINDQLDGEIDLSSLANKNLEEIHFSEGKISRIVKVPTGIKKIVINDNALEEVPVQRDLVYLEANNNRLSKADLKEMVNLVSLFLKKNKIQKIENLPESLQNLHIDYNNLDELDLSKVPNCTNINCENNPRLYKIIGGKQISDPDFILKKDAHAQISLFGGGPKKRNSPKENVLYADLKEALNEYYALKNKYEESKKDAIKKIMKTGNESEKSKIKKARNAVFKCVNCGKAGGSIFIKEDNHLKASCGNTQNPCNLNISILSSLSFSDNDIRTSQEHTDRAKQNIIKTKMNALFGYLTDKTSVEAFERNIQTIVSNKLDYGKNTVTSSYYEMQNDSKKTTLISKKMANIHEKLAEIRRDMHEYSVSKNTKILETVAQKQKQIQDALIVIRSIKYPIHEMVQETVHNLVDDEGNFMDESKAPKMDLNVLKQYPYNFDDFLNPNLEMLEVQKFAL
jgi:hypothetical protein